MKQTIAGIVFLIFSNYAGAACTAKFMDNRTVGSDEISKLNSLGYQLTNISPRFNIVIEKIGIDSTWVLGKARNKFCGYVESVSSGTRSEAVCYFGSSVGSRIFSNGQYFPYSKQWDNRDYIAIKKIIKNLPACTDFAEE